MVWLMVINGGGVVKRFFDSFLHVPVGFELRDVRFEFRDEESLDDALKYFRQACSQSGHLQALRVKDQHENAAEKRKRKREQAQFMTRIERNNERYERQYSNGPYNFDRK
jgi:ribosomal protein S21